MRVVRFSKSIKHYILGESIKDIEMNRILDKMNNNENLTEREKRFRNLYSQTTDEDFKDYMYLSKNSAFDVLSKILKNNKKVICDLHDRNGKLGLEIVDVINDFNHESCVIIMKGNQKHELHDRFLYNIIYNSKKDEYSIQEQDEYFEKISISGDDY